MPQPAPSHATRAALVVLTLFTLSAAPAAAIQFDSYDPQRHDRFVNGQDNPDFLLAGVDLSAVAKRGNASSGAVLFTPQHFITADHLKPTGVGGSLTFRGTDGTDRSYTVASYTQLTTAGQGSDLSIGTLTAPIDPITDFINPVPIAFAFDIDDFIGLEVYTFGKGDRAGRNVIVDTGLVQFSSGQPRPSVAFATVYDTVENGGNGLGPDEAGLQGGDSGNAALTLIDGQLAVLGAHFAIASGLPDNSPLVPFSDDDPYLNISSLMGPYALQIDPIVQSNGQSLQLLLIPEPATSALLLLGLTLARTRRPPSARPPLR